MIALATFHEHHSADLCRGQAVASGERDRRLVSGRMRCLCAVKQWDTLAALCSRAPLQPYVPFAPKLLRPTEPLRSTLVPRRSCPPWTQRCAIPIFAGSSAPHSEPETETPTTMGPALDSSAFLSDRPIFLAGMTWSLEGSRSDRLLLLEPGLPGRGPEPAMHA